MLYFSGSIFCECHDVEDFLAQNKEIIEGAQRLDTTNPKALMDKMSIQLLKNYQALTPNERNVLKLSLSYIVDKSNDNLSIYQKYIMLGCFWKVVDDIKSDIKLIEEEKKNLEAISKETACRKGVDEGLEVILTQQLTLIKERRRFSSEYQMLQSFSYLKIDLIVCNDDDVEPAFCEFKSNNKKNLVQHQVSKNLRLNQTIKVGMWKLFVDDALVFFNREGRSGRFSSLQKLDGVFVNEPKAAIVIPTKLKKLDDGYFKTFIALLEWKKHLLTVEKKMTKSFIKADRRECEYQITCFTAVNTKKRKTVP
ncbi:hypothetical protein EDC96DRAFT_567224 [Choanephora cucurbitarum]|nr:hypothetical protein EDC96DRAFT_567224 [Choanephora cucurbitarum]